ncbi:YkvA family protein [Desulfitobacterium metallireducens]|uniref:Methyltransferase type 11 n=1 Tax=Desulfitobacterium metallireducens DSM 15288 TaxID=871968 RepID=W0EDH4_9FIRM|nr:YkvA family protein [Desulfitobacterium metallireducens]AHF07229.1 methyltransferase type 11 [Desulfitobacterium metallireducens DSM 15288]
MKKFDESAAINMFSGYVSKGEDILKNPSKVEETIKKALEKAKESRGPLDEIWHDLQLMFGIAGDWVKGNYREVPVGSIAAIIGALLYFISPVDLIPDVIPGVGLIDDVFVLSIAIRQVRSDLRKYEQWKNA